MAAPQAAGERGTRLAAGRDAVERAGKPGQQAAQHGADCVVLRAFDAVERLARRFQLRPRDCRQRPRRAVADFAAVHAQGQRRDLVELGRPRAVRRGDGVDVLDGRGDAKRDRSGGQREHARLDAFPLGELFGDAAGVCLEGIARADDVPAAGILADDARRAALGEFGRRDPGLRQTVVASKLRKVCLDAGQLELPRHAPAGCAGLSGVVRARSRQRDEVDGEHRQCERQRPRQRARTIPADAHTVGHGIPPSAKAYAPAGPLMKG